jgi:hypothetical protein
MTAADYARAEKFMGYNVTPLVYRSGVRGNWLPDERFWYRVTTPGGSEATLVDPVKGTKSAWDYFVKHLLNMEPPKEYELKPPSPGRGGSGQ